MFTFRELINKYFYSNRLKGDIDCIIVSAIFGKYNECLYELEIEFEPMGSLGSGDSWRWRTTKMSEEQIHKYVYEMLFIDLSKIESLPDREEFNTAAPDNISQQCIDFDKKYHGGRLFLPQRPIGIQWKLWPGKYTDYTI